MAWIIQDRASKINAGKKKSGRRLAGEGGFGRGTWLEVIGMVPVFIGMVLNIDGSKYGLVAMLTMMFSLFRYSLESLECL